MFHVHIYFNEAAKQEAMDLRQKIAQEFPDLKLGRVHDAPIGPHTQGSYLALVINLIQTRIDPE